MTPSFTCDRRRALVSRARAVGKRPDGAHHSDRRGSAVAAFGGGHEAAAAAGDVFVMQHLHAGVVSTEPAQLQQPAVYPLVDGYVLSYAEYRGRVGLRPPLRPPDSCGGL